MGRQTGSKNGETAAAIEVWAKAGYHAAAIAAKLGITRQAVSRIAADHGISIENYADLAARGRRKARS